MLDLQKSQDSTIPEITTKALEDRADAAGQPTMAALESLLDEMIQKEGTQAIANDQKLSILDNGDAGYLGFN